MTDAYIHSSHNQPKPHVCTPRFQHGPFSAVLGPTLLQKQTPVPIEELTAGLLSQAPDPDGLGAVEVCAVGYQRCTIESSRYDAHHEAIMTSLSFSLAEGVNAGHLGLFDLEGRLRYYGQVIGYRTHPSMPTLFEFGPHKVLLKRFQPVDPCARGWIGGAPRKWTPADLGWISSEIVI